MVANMTTSNEPPPEEGFIIGAAQTIKELTAVIAELRDEIEKLKKHDNGK
jgi:uncharacterized small protein (DUF1192 family)